jgi:single-strand DNA-binding protein
MNKVALVRNITDDSEPRYTQSGLLVVLGGVADRDGESCEGRWQVVTDGLFRRTAWRSVAENASRSLKKGTRAFVAGKLVQRTFEAEGHKRTTVEIQVSHLGPDLQFAVAEVTRPSSGDSTWALTWIVSSEGGSPGNRTPNLRIKSPLLCQLS